MPHEIANLRADVAQATVRASPAAIPAAARTPGTPGAVPAPEEAPEGRPVVQVEARHVAFAALASGKDEASRMAQSAREMQRALQAASVTLQAMRQAVDAVLKQYPPFPPGSEQRVGYLNSVAALRQQIEAMTVPPPQDEAGVVIYPRLDDLPELDPSSATDEDIAAFARTLQAVTQGVEAGQARLRDHVAALPAKLHVALPPPMAEPEALVRSQTTAADLSARGAPLLANSQWLAQIGD